MIFTLAILFSCLSTPVIIEVLEVIGENKPTDASVTIKVSCRMTAYYASYYVKYNTTET